MSSARVERAAYFLGGNRSIHLSYEDKKKKIVKEWPSLPQEEFIGDIWKQILV